MSGFGTKLFTDVICGSCRRCCLIWSRSRADPFTPRAPEHRYSFRFLPLWVSRASQHLSLNTRRRLFACASSCYPPWRSSTSLTRRHLSSIQEHDIKNLFGRKVAIDASMSIYQFLIAVRQKDGELLTNDAGETTR